MASDWRYLEFRDLCEHSAFGPRFSSDDYARDGNIACLRTMDIDSNGRINFAAMPLAKLDLAKFRNHILQRHDIVITRTGAYLGKAAVFTEFRLPVLAGAFSIYFRLKRNLADPLFYRYYFNSPEGQTAIWSIATGSAQPNLNITNLHSLKVPLPPIHDQRAIVDILGSLDDKIELNRRMNGTLERMAAAVFKSWFIDFDPVRAKSEGRDPNLPADLAALFSDSFVESDLGPIPEGWMPGTLGDIADTPRRSVDPADVAATTPYIGLEHMPRRCIALDTWGQADEVASGKSQFKQGEILFGKLRPYFHKVGISPVDGVCSTDIVVVVPKAEHWRGFVASLVSSKAFVDYTDSRSAGTKMPRTNWNDMGSYPIALPPEILAKAFQAHVATLHQRITLNVRQNRRLAGLRDTLLPKLLSGEIDISPAEEIIEGMP